MLETKDFRKNNMKKIFTAENGSKLGKMARKFCLLVGISPLAFLVLLCVMWFLIIYKALQFLESLFS